MVPVSIIHGPGYVGKEKSLSLHPSKFLAEIPVIKDKLTKEKQTSLLTSIFHVYIGDIQEKNG